jgi:hydroxyacylglutathione hydrolase
MAMLEIMRVPVLSDNYVWLVHDPDSDETLVIDPSVAEPVLDAAASRGWRISQIWNTHWHGDHIGGDAGIVAATGATVTAPAAELSKIPNVDYPVGEGDVVHLGAHEARVMAVPAHTAGHIAFHFAADEIVFVGDTLFAMGCGRLFEGTPDQMFDNMARLSALPAETRVYCAHEYTLSNGKYAIRAEPDNADIARRLDEVEAMRARGEATVPTTIALERATNPFMRAGSVAELARRRAEKDKG